MNSASTLKSESEEIPLFSMLIIYYEEHEVHCVAIRPPHNILSTLIEKRELISSISGDSYYCDGNCVSD